MNKKVLEEMIRDTQSVLLWYRGLRFFGSLYQILDKKILPQSEMDRLTKHAGCPACTTGKILFYTSDFNWSIRPFIFVTIHEILHILGFHLTRLGDRDFDIWQISTDHVINRTLMEIGYLTPLEGCIFLKGIHNKYPNIRVEDLYDLLSNNVDLKIDKNKRKVEIHGEKFPIDSDTNLNKNIETTETDISENCDNICKKASVLWRDPDITSRGSMSGSMEYLIDGFFKIDLPWNTIFSNSLLYSIQNNRSRSWSRPNIYTRRFFKSPGKKKRNMGLHSIVSCVDISGSITDDNFKLFKGVLLDCMPHIKKLICYMHDVNIKKSFEASNKNILLKELSMIKGRGGTSHIGVFDKIEELYMYEKISCVVFLTDFYSDVKYIYPNYKWIYRIPSIWILNSNNKVSLDIDNIKTIYIN